MKNLSTLIFLLGLVIQSITLNASAMDKSYSSIADDFGPVIEDKVFYMSDEFVVQSTQLIYKNRLGELTLIYAPSNKPQDKSKISLEGSYSDMHALKKDIAHKNAHIYLIDYSSSIAGNTEAKVIVEKIKFVKRR